MVAEPWIVKMGSQVSSNLKHALLLETSKKKSLKNNQVPNQTIGILSFEVATVMSKTVHLHKSLTDAEISKLMTEILKSEGVLNLVSSDGSYLLELALGEKLDDLNSVAGVVSRLGKKCSEPALQGFEHVYGDVVSGVIEVRELGFLVRDMEGMVRKMERLVNATANLYSEMEVLNELEQATKKFQHNQHEESKRTFEQKLMWQRQDVRHLQEISLWNLTYDKVVELLARTACTIYSRICTVFGDPAMKKKNNQCGPFSGQIDLHRHLHTGPGSEPLKRVLSRSSGCHSGKKGVSSFNPQIDSRRGEISLFRPEDLNFSCGTSPGRLFMDCLSLSSSVSKFEDDDDDAVHREDPSSQVSGVYSSGNPSLKRSEHTNHSNLLNRSRSRVAYKSGEMPSDRFGPKSRLTVYAPPNTVGGSALALHYANVIIVIEKLLRYPHLVGEEARDDLYQMMPTSLRMSLRTSLKSYENLAIYDAPLAHDWKDNLEGILKWLAPLAHNMIRWQSERNFEQHQIVTRSNVLLLQTLYFTDRKGTEAAICKLLVGLNYICRYEHQQNALLDCASSFDFEDCMQWQLQCGAAYLH